MTSSSSSVPITTPSMRAAARVFFLSISVLQNVLSLERHVLVRLRLDLSAAFQGQVLSFDQDGPVLFHHDRRLAAADRDRLALGLDGDILLGQQGVLLYTSPSPRD